MKIPTVSLFNMCASVIGQDRVDEQRERLARQMAQEKMMVSAIVQHQTVPLQEHLLALLPALLRLAAYPR